jgi:hypothetical protein
MKNLQFLTDTTLTSEDLTSIKGGKRLNVVQTTMAAASRLTAGKKVLYNGKVYTVTVDASGKAAMVSADHLDTCVEW